MYKLSIHMPKKRQVESDSSSDEGVVDATPVKKSKNGGNRVKNADGEEERNRAVDSPLGHLDPSRITHMVVDQVGLGGPAVHPDNDGFVVPGPPYQVKFLPKYIFFGTFK
ncbi:hypothetical protein OSTOST_10038 [Ostertagia ostertagi]